MRAVFVLSLSFLSFSGAASAQTRSKLMRDESAADLLTEIIQSHAK